MPPAAGVLDYTGDITAPASIGCSTWGCCIVYNGDLA